MKRFKRIISIIAASILVVCFALPLDALAATPGTTTTIDATYRCYKGSDVGTAGTAPIGDSHYYWHYNGDGTALNCPIRFMKESGTGRPIYCIEVGATFGGGYSYSTRELEDSPYWNNLSSTARSGITYTTMYGYPVNNYGAANCDAYAATQTIIWEFAKGYRNLSGRTNAYFYNLMISGSPAESAYNQLSDAVSKHSTVPSFAYKSASSADSNSSELKYNSSTKQWEKTFTDSNNVLSGYNAAGSGLSLTKSGNTLKVVSTQKISGTKRVTLERPVPQTGQALLALYSTSSQNAIIGQLQDSMTSYLSVSTENVGGTVSVKKTNEAGTAMSGVVFGIYSDSGCTKKITSITTNSSGTATSGEIDTLTYPKVYVREDSMTSDQSAVYNLNSTVYTVTLVAAENVWANGGSAVVNAWKDGYVKVFKKDEAGKVLSGVVFGVYSDSGCSSLITKATTGSDGYGTSPAIDTGTSGSRTVYVKEYSMTSEQSAVYNINTTVYPVTISAGKTVNVNNGNAVVNMWKDGYIKVTKQNEAGTGLAGVVFGVYSDSNCSTLVTKITIGSDGVGTSAAIDTGTTGTRALYVKEISMTADQIKVYKMNTTVYPVTISAGKTVAVNNGSPVVNDWLPAKISVTKVISSGAKLSGAEFTAYTDKDCKNILTDMAGKNVVITTDKDGKATSAEIYVGKSGSRTVYVKETALDNTDADIIDLNQTVFPVTLQPNVTTIVNDGKAVVNEYKPGKVKSYLMKSLLVNLREAGKKIIVLDAEGEYRELTESLGGCYVEMMSGKYKINPLEPKTWVEPDDDDDDTAGKKKGARLNRHISYLKDFFRVCKGFNDAQLDTIEIMLGRLYAGFAITEYTDFSTLRPENYPTMSDFYELVNHEYISYKNDGNQLYTKKTLQEICLGLYSMCKGAEAVYFNGHTNISDDMFICFGVKGLMDTNQRLKDAMLFNILSYMSNELLDRGNTAASIDELYLFLTNTTAIEYIRNASKRVRKKDSAVILASQNINDFLVPGICELTKPLFAIPSHQFLFNPGQIDPKAFMDTLQLEQSEYDLIRYPERGSCLYRCGNERYLLQVTAPEYKSRLFGKAGGR